MSLGTFSETWVAADDLDMQGSQALGDVNTNFDMFVTDRNIVLDQAHLQQPTDHFTSHMNSHFTTSAYSCPSSTTTTAAASATTTSPDNTCPHCHQHQSNIRTHVGLCFAASLPQTKPRRSDADETKRRLASVSASAAKLSLSQRIGLLESLGRLAMLASKKGKKRSDSFDADEKGEDQTQVPETEMESDRFALSLLFHNAAASRAAAPSPAKRRRKLTVQVDAPLVEPVEIPAAWPHVHAREAYETTSPSTTASDEPGDWSDDVMLSHKWTTDGKRASTPPSHGLSAARPVVSGTKRKRGAPSGAVVQALSFDPDCDMHMGMNLFSSDFAPGVNVTRNSMHMEMLSEGFFEDAFAL